MSDQPAEEQQARDWRDHRALGVWLRQQRQGCGWTIREMGRRLCQAAKDSGDKTVPGVDAMIRNIRRWESGVTGVSERHTLYYCKALGIPPERFGPPSQNGQDHGWYGITVRIHTPSHHQPGDLVAYMACAAEAAGRVLRDLMGAGR